MADIQGLELIKSSNKSYAVVGDTVTYTLTAMNVVSIPINNVNIYDLLAPELEFIAGSVKKNGVASPSDNILAGVSLGTLLPGAQQVVSFAATILSAETATIVNIATGQYNYQLIGGPIQEGEATSNAYEVNVFNTQIDITKTANVDQVLLGDVITYTVTLTNSGDLNALNVAFSDSLPTQLVLVPGSFKIGTQVVNGINLQKGVVIGSIAPGQSVVITYQAKVIGANCSGILTNQAQATFQYQLPDGSVGTETTQSETDSVETEIAITTFKQMSVESYLTIPTAKPDIEAINVTTGTIDITSCHVINTPQTSSTEGQQLTGYKLVIRGDLYLVIEYTALDEEQSVHSAHYSIPFSTFIVLPPNYSVGSKLDIEGVVEDVYSKTIDVRNFFVNATVLINTKILGI